MVIEAVLIWLAVAHVDSELNFFRIMISLPFAPHGFNKYLLVVVALFFSPSFIIAESAVPNTTIADVPLQFHRLFSDHMVMQRDTGVRIYGSGKPGVAITVKLDGVTASTQVAADGDWQVLLTAFPAGGPHRLEATGGGQVVAVNDIHFGDVWIASGQSNMDWKVGGGVLDLEKEVAAARLPKIRFFNVPTRLSDKPEKDLVEGRWQVASAQSIGDCSAVAWFFAHKVHKETTIPIGIVSCAVGGTPVEAWMSASAMQRFANKKQAMLDALNAKHGSWTNAIEENNHNIQRLIEQVDQSMEAFADGVLDAEFDDSAWTEAGVFAAPPEKIACVGGDARSLCRPNKLQRP